MTENGEVLETVKSNSGKDILIYPSTNNTKKVVYGRYTVYADTEQQLKEAVERFKKFDNFDINSTQLRTENRS